jgi:hypothetical protein
VLAPTASAANGIYAGVSTLGVNLGYKYGLSETIGFRVGINRFDFGRTITENGVEYKGDLKLNSVELLADWHPFGNGFALTGGALVNNNKFSGRAAQNDTITIDGRVYEGIDGVNPQAHVTGRLGKGLTPYLGLGYTVNPVAAKGFGFNFGLGVVFQKPDANLTVSGVADPDGTLEADRRSAERKLKSDLNKLRNYPVVSIGISYAF